MVNINYTRLFNLRMAHDYFDDRMPRGLTIRPTAQTLHRFTGSKMLFKSIPSGLTVLYRAEADGLTPFVDIGPTQHFSFLLTSDNRPEFENITDLDVSPPDRFTAGRLLYFANNPANASTDATSPEELTHTLIDGTRNSLFSYTFTLETPPSEVLLRITSPGGATVPAGTQVDGSSLPDPLTIKKDDDDFYRQQIDLRKRPKGLYTFTIRSGDDTSTLKEEQFYVDDDVAAQDILGVIDIIYVDAPGHLFGDTEEYSLTFSRKETVWTYYIVNKNGFVVFDDHDLVITDPGSAEYPAVNFDREGDEPSADVKINGFDTVVFKSDAPIPFRDLPKSDLQLVRNPGGSVLIQHLPNPSHAGIVKESDGQLESEVYVFI